MTNVSWNDAQRFIAWLSRKEGETYRLPTEAEWEYACRAGTTSRYYFGDDPQGMAAMGNVADETAKTKYPSWHWTISVRDWFVYTSPVGHFQPNKFGLFDMYGNVCEWCSDWYRDDYYTRLPMDDRQKGARASNRVYRGGSWVYAADTCRSASRGKASNSGCDLGFRVASNPLAGIKDPSGNIVLPDTLRTTKTPSHKR